MEQFSLSEYLKNPTRQIVTRDGYSVRIICTDRMGKWPIVALVCKGKEEYLVSYTRDGRRYIPIAEVTFDDLFFAPETKTKKEFCPAAKRRARTPRFQRPRTYAPSAFLWKKRCRSL